MTSASETQFHVDDDDVNEIYATADLDVDVAVVYGPGPGSETMSVDLAKLPALIGALSRLQARVEAGRC